MLYLLRRYLSIEQAQNLLLSLKDPQLAKALVLLHQSPAKAWTLQELAQDIGMSRAVLAKRFKEGIQQTMYGYLTELRMEAAKQLLAESGTRWDFVPAKVGYQSELSFVRAFKQYAKMTPLQYQQQRQLDDKTFT